MFVTLIAGLPGSGKSTLARNLVLGISGAVVIDDPMTLDCLDRIPEAASDVVITHPVFCRPSARAKVESEVLSRRPEAFLRWIFFANDPDACRRNVARRADGRSVDGYVTAMSLDYVMPDGAEVRPVYQPAEHGDAQCWTPSCGKT